ncbi:MAG: hypothetical protein Q9219_005840 [cf. Caloplaca sp. 3 TL-2023]
MEGSSEQTIALSVLDQLPFMRTYTQMLLCFPLAQDVDRSSVVKSLERAAAILTEAIPILAGQVVNYKDPNADVETSGTFQVTPYDHPNGSPVQVKVLDDFISYEELREAKAPASMLDATILAPMVGYPEHYANTDETPVWVIQANFISGGLLLCFAGMHNAMDGTGLGQLIRMYATICRGETLSVEDLEAANFDRKSLPATLKPGQTQMSHPEVAPKSNRGKHQQFRKSASIGLVVFQYIRFQAEEPQS